MFDEDEWGTLFPLHIESVNAQKRYGWEETPESWEAALGRYRTFCEALEQITGEKSDDPRLCIWHRHRISSRGDPCPQCGKVMRMPGACRCFECGWCGGRV